MLTLCHSQVIIDFSFELNWFVQILASLGFVNVNHQVRQNLRKDIAALRQYMNTQEITTPETTLDFAGDE